MMPKYDLIYEEQGELKIQSVSAETKGQAQELAAKANVSVKGIVFSDDNLAPEKQE